MAGTDFGELSRAVACPTSKVDHDTGLWPDRNPAGVAISSASGNEVWDLSDPDAGLTANGDSFFPDWQGPYLSGPFQDPWGHNYLSNIVVFSPSRRLYPPACKPYELEAGPEANWGEAPNLGC